MLEGPFPLPLKLSTGGLVWSLAEGAILEAAKSNLVDFERVKIWEPTENGFEWCCAARYERPAEKRLVPSTRSPQFGCSAGDMIAID